MISAKLLTSISATVILLLLFDHSMQIIHLEAFKHDNIFTRCKYSAYLSISLKPVSQHRTVKIPGSSSPCPGQQKNPEMAVHDHSDMSCHRRSLNLYVTYKQYRHLVICHAGKSRTSPIVGIEGAAPLRDTARAAAFEASRNASAGFFPRRMPAIK
jgi:hypothetical protein